MNEESLNLVKIQYPLYYQNLFTKNTTPWDSKEWDLIKLEKIKIEFQDIKAFYYINVNDNNKNDRRYELLCRVSYEGKRYFIQICAYCDNTGFENNRGGGLLCITKYANVFLRDIVTNNQNLKTIYNTLKEEGYQLEDYKSYMIDRITDFLEYHEEEIEDMENLIIK